ncbi:MAG TPA: ribonuclease E inhibitor RraB, partial [Myxococcales bacterium]|nr:ribonuclease E inhibitor RraB [Myxococcales bacterium]
KGDVARIRAGEEFVYVQYLGKHPEYGATVAVCPEKQSKVIKVTPKLFDEAYVIFYPLNASVGRGVALVVERLPHKLTVPRDVPDADIWDHELLLRRVADGWRPEPEVSEDEESPAAAAAAASEICTVTHYLYCQTEGDALELSSALNDRGFQTAQESSTVEGSHWLVLATHEVADEEALEQARQGLSSLASSCRGEYDGWQTEPGSPCVEVLTNSGEFELQ